MANFPLLGGKKEEEKHLNLNMWTPMQEPLSLLSPSVNKALKFSSIRDFVQHGAIVKVFTEILGTLLISGFMLRQ